MKRFILVGAGSVAALVAAVVVIGYLLPVEHVAAVSATYPRPPGEVFEAVSDFAAQPEWRPGVERMERREDRDGRPVWVEIGGSGPMPMTVDVLEPPSRLVTTILDEGLPFGGSWTYEIAATPEGGSVVTITERGKVYNPVFRFVSRFVMGHHATATTYLTDLGEHLGVSTTPERVQLANQ